MLYIGNVWPFSIIRVVLLVFALSNQVSEAREYINEGKFCKRPSGPSTMVTRDLLGFCNIRNNSLSPAFRLPCWQALLCGVSAGELPVRLERGYVRVKWSLSNVPVKVNPRTPHPPGRDIAEHLRGIFRYLTSERTACIEDFDLFCTSSKNSGGVDRGIFHRGGLGQGVGLQWKQDGGTGKLNVFFKPILWNSVFVQILKYIFKH